ncbi:MAG: 6-carboxytetrahydropterin synthase [Dehalococcoidia bacterium]|nr:6-carboxytetrahydropterin synthase [Dehalococcoidia bacterium]
MARHQITKQIDFSYGHRLLEHKGKCRYLHGHNGLLEVTVESDALDGQGMVVDFGDLRDVVKGWVDENLDHRMLLCRRDPVVAMLTDMGEPLFLMDENPTAENISKVIFKAVRQQGLRISEVRLWETPSSYAVYREE